MHSLTHCHLNFTSLVSLRGSSMVKMTFNIPKSKEYRFLSCRNLSATFASVAIPLYLKHCTHVFVSVSIMVSSFLSLLKFWNSLRLSRLSPNFLSLFLPSLGYTTDTNAFIQHTSAGRPETSPFCSGLKCFQV